MMNGQPNYGDLLRVLALLGFREEPTDGDHVLLRNAEHDSVVLLPRMDIKADVRRVHLIATRRQLVEQGVVEPDRFDRLVAEQTLAKAS